MFLFSYFLVFFFCISISFQNTFTSSVHSPIFSGQLLGASIARQGLRRKVVREKEVVVVDIDEYGNLPVLKAIYEEALVKAPTCVAIRARNATVFAYQWETVVRSLQVPLGGKPMNMLINPWQYLLVTGFAGDCRVITRYAQQIVLNHTMEFNTQPTGEFIAQRLSDFLRAATRSSGKRPFCCHAFVADALVHDAGEPSASNTGKLDDKGLVGGGTGTLYEVDAAGRLAKVRGGVAGKGMMKGRAMLEEAITKLLKNPATIDEMTNTNDTNATNLAHSSSSELTIEEAKALARKIMMESFDSSNTTTSQSTTTSKNTTFFQDQASDSIEIFVLRDYIE